MFRFSFIYFTFLLLGISNCQLLTTNKILSPEKQWLLQFQNYVTSSVNKTLTVTDDNLLKFNVSIVQSSKNLSSWFNLPLLPIVFAESPYIPEGQCKKDVQKYLNELRNGTLWATKMFDSSTKYPDGILYGYTRHFGNFDECYNIDVQNIPKVKENDIGEISGRYCLVNFHIQKQDIAPIKHGSYNLIFDEFDSAWEAITEKGDIRRVQRYKVQLALCVPSSCNEADIETALKLPLQKIAAENNIILQATVEPEFCQSRKDTLEFSIGAKIYCTILIIIFIIVIVSTWYDYVVNEEEDSLIFKALLCFSARKTCRKIFQVRYQHPALDSIHLIRFFSTCLVVLGHRFLHYYIVPTINAESLEYLYLYPVSMIIFNGMLIVDIFIAVGGFITTYNLLDILQKSKRINFLYLIATRLWRLTPAYACIFCFYTLILPHIGSGPLWKSQIEKITTQCGASWWTSMLYINNYVKPDHFCMLQAWYLSVDFQLYIVSLFILYLFSQLPRKIGYPFLGILTIASCIISFYILITNNIGPFVHGMSYHNLHENSYFINYYIKSHLRCTPYLLGAITGAIIFDHKQSPWRLSKVYSRTLFLILVVFLPLKTQAIGHRFFDPGYNSPLEAALYGSLYRGVFSITACALLILLTVGDGLDFHYNFMTPPWVQPLARLSYSVFLVHNIMQLYQIGTARTAITYFIHNDVWNFVPDIVFAYVIAFILVLGVEAPFRMIVSQFVLKKRNDCKDSSPTLINKKDS